MCRVIYTGDPFFMAQVVPIIAAAKRLLSGGSSHSAAEKFKEAIPVIVGGHLEMPLPSTRGGLYSTKYVSLPLWQRIALMHVCNSIGEALMKTDSYEEVRETLTSQLSSNFHVHLRRCSGFSRLLLYTRMLPFMIGGTFCSVGLSMYLPNSKMVLLNMYFLSLRLLRRLVQHQYTRKCRLYRTCPCTGPGVECLP